MPDCRVRPAAAAVLRFFAVGYAVLLLVQVAAWTGTWQQATNTLYRNGRWLPTKITIGRALMGAHTYYLSRRPLQGNSLNLAPWHGFQEVILRQPVSAERIDFDFLLTPTSYAIAIFDRGPDGFAGVRISRHPRLPGCFFAATVDGEFLRTWPLAAAAPAAGVSHRAALAFGPAGVALTIDGAAAGSAPLAHRPGRQVGFRGGANKTLVDELAVRQPGGQSVTEDFSNHQDPLPAALLALLAVTVANLAAAVAIVRGSRQPAFALLALNLTLAAAAGLTLGYYRWFKTDSYPAVDEVLREKERRWQQQQFAVIRDRLETGYARTPAPGVTRVLFLGTSQTYGIGVDREDQTFVKRVEAGLNRGAGRARYECLNAAVPGANSSDLLHHYTTLWRHYAPAAVVLNLSNNDSDESVFRRNLAGFADATARDGARLVLVLEANSVEKAPGPLPLHAAMRELAAARGLAVVDLHGYLGARCNAGLFWWDSVHLGGYGHRLAADCLLPAVRAAAGG